MAIIEYDVEADAALTRLEADGTMPELAARLNDALDRLESAPGDAFCRRIYFSARALWCISVTAPDGTQWWVLWRQVDPHDEDWAEDASAGDEVVHVAYIGPEASNFR